MKIGGQIPWEDSTKRRFGETFNGPIIPFGSLFEYYLISAKDQSRIHQFGKSYLEIFLGSALYAGGIWKGDILVASEIHAGRLNAKEVITHQNGDLFIFPSADGKVKLSG